VRRLAPPGVRVDVLRLLELWDYEGGLSDQVGAVGGQVPVGTLLSSQD
jgi:hypothetical protein